MEAGPGVKVTSSFTLRCCGCRRGRYVVPFVVKGEGGKLVIRASIEGSVQVGSGDVSIEASGR